MAENKEQITLKKGRPLVAAEEEFLVYWLKGMFLFICGDYIYEFDMYFH